MIYIKRNSCLSLLPSNGYDNRNNNNNNNINNKNNKREHLYRIAPYYPSTVVKGILLNWLKYKQKKNLNENERKYKFG